MHAESDKIGDTQDSKIFRDRGRLVIIFLKRIELGLSGERLNFEPKKPSN